MKFPHCENCRNCSSGRSYLLYVKIIMMNIRPSKREISLISKVRNFDFWEISLLDMNQHTIFQQNFGNVSVEFYEKDLFPYLLVRKIP